MNIITRQDSADIFSEPVPYCNVCGHHHEQGTRCPICGHSGRANVFKKMRVRSIYYVMIINIVMIYERYTDRIAPTCVELMR